MEQNNNQQQVIDLAKIAKTLWQKRRTFYKVWAVTFVLSCIWIFPQPRYYTCEVKLAPEMSGDQSVNGLANIASAFGINAGVNGGYDAIYPELYPELFESPEFTFGLFDIRVKTLDGEINTDYYTYLDKHQEKNILTYPFRKAIGWVKKLFSSAPRGGGGNEHNSFFMSEKEQAIMAQIQGNVVCSIDKKTNVITLSTQDQDALIAATLADSVRIRLQDFIIMYRTKKARQDMEYYQALTDSARTEYRLAQIEYSRYCDTHRSASLQTTLSERDRLENELSIKLGTYQTVMAQLQAMKAKVQERMPAFTTLQSATVPIKPSKPKRMFFVLGMLIIVTLGTCIWIPRNYILGKE